MRGSTNAKTTATKATAIAIPIKRRLVRLDRAAAVALSCAIDGKLSRSDRCSARTGVERGDCLCHPPQHPISSEGATMTGKRRVSASPATAIALLALFFALGGSALAVG